MHPTTAPIHPDPLSEILCRVCQRRPPRWNDVLCQECSAAQAYRRLWQQSISTWGRWMMTSLSEGLLGIGLGGILLIALTAPAHGGIHRSDFLLIIGVLLLVAGLVVGVNATLLAQAIRRVRWWALLSGFEVIVNWVVLFGVVQLIGQTPGITAAVGVGVGISIAAVQARLLQAQAQSTWLWLIGSIGAWAIGGAVSIAIEFSTLFATDPLARILFGIAASRLVYGTLSGIVLSWLLWPRSQAQQMPS
jgi:hypothetical protein